MHALVFGSLGGAILLSFVIFFIDSSNSFTTKLFHTLSTFLPIAALIIGIVSSLNPNLYGIEYLARILLISIGSCFLITSIFYNIFYYWSKIHKSLNEYNDNSNHHNFIFYLWILFTSASFVLMVVAALSYTKPELILFSDTIKKVTISIGSVLFGILFFINIFLTWGFIYDYFNEKKYEKEKMLSDLNIHDSKNLTKEEQDKIFWYKWDKLFKRSIKFPNELTNNITNNIYNNDEDTNTKKSIIILPKQDLEIKKIIELLKKYSIRHYWINFNEEEFKKYMKNKNEYILCSSSDEDKLCELKDKMINDEINCVLK